ncbi:MAG: hypothetical protein WAL88_06875 [Nitrosotalea sp.]
MSYDINTQMIIVAITSILSFVTGWGITVLNDKKNQSHTVSSTIRSMLAELKSMKKVIDAGSIKPAIQVNETGADGKFNIDMNYHSFHTATYDSVLYSGVFRELEPETQRKIADTYESIKMYNSIRVQGQNIALSLSSLSTSNLRENVMSYGSMVETILKIVIKNIEELITLLEEKYSKG